MAIDSTFLITNRAPAPGGFGPTLAQGGALTCTEAPPGTSRFSAVSTGTFATDLSDALFAQRFGSPTLTVFVHGYDASWESIQSLVPVWFGNLAAHGYTGTLLAFDWPSDKTSDWFPTSFRAAQANARATASDSFPQLMAFLQPILDDLQSQGCPVRLNVLCHSMGNYLLSFAAPALPTGCFRRVLCVAAELDRTSFDVAMGSGTDGAAIAACCDVVTAYHSIHDTLLLGCGIEDGWQELGWIGPYSHRPLQPNFVGVDCSAVINDANAKFYQASEPHTAYFFIPETLLDLTVALLDEAPRFRAPLPDTSQGFTLIDDPAGGLQLGGSAPRAQRDADRVSANSTTDG